MNEERQPFGQREFARWWEETGERELRQVLYWKWDPLGVNDFFPDTEGEYDTYAPEVVSALRRGATQAEIIDLLRAIERDRMDLSNTPPADRLHGVARNIAAWFSQSLDSWANSGPGHR